MEALTNLSEIRLSFIPCGTKFIFEGKEYEKRSRYRAIYKGENKHVYVKTFKKHEVVLIDTSKIEWGK